MTSSGVPWISWTYTPLATRTDLSGEIRASAIAKPTMPPPISAITDRPIVHSAPWPKNIRWLMLRCPPMVISQRRAEPATAREQHEAKAPETGAHHQRQNDVEHGDDDVGLERAVGVRLDVVGDRGELFRRNLRADRGGQHQQHELAGQRRIDLL